MFNMTKKFSHLPTVRGKPTYKFATQGMYVGYKSLDFEIIDGEGTEDKEETFIMRGVPTSQSIPHGWYRTKYLTNDFRSRKRTSLPFLPLCPLHLS